VWGREREGGNSWLVGRSSCAPPPPPGPRALCEVELTACFFLILGRVCKTLSYGAPGLKPSQQRACVIKGVWGRTKINNVAVARSGAATPKPKLPCNGPLPVQLQLQWRTVLSVNSGYVTAVAVGQRQRLHALFWYQNAHQALSQPLLK
jgi:hypothetical protein